MSFFGSLKRIFGFGTPDPGSAATPTSDSPPMIECHQAMEKLFEFLDRELDPGEHEQVAKHFEVCARCYPHLVFEQSFRDALHRAREGEAPPPEVRGKVIEALKQEGFVPSDP
jgi:anti-sigma factor (TIGR02949 family)